MPASSSGGNSGAFPLLAAFLLPPRQPGFLAQLDRYDLLKLVGAGGMGVVFLARAGPNPSAMSAEGAVDNLDNKPAPAFIQPGDGAAAPPAPLVALKILKPELHANPRAMALFRKETEHLRQLNHPHILKLIETSPSPERAYFVMPWFEQGSLANRLLNGKPLHPDAVLRWGKQMASALDHAHRKGIIHRDLKPANILLNSEENAVVADFGLARTVFNDSLWDVARAGAEGTSAYLSPMLAAGEAEDTRCDIYAFGAILYELLTGKPPYQGSSREEIIRQILAGPPAPIASLNPAAPRVLAAVAEGAMAREHRDRYASIADVMADLDQITNGNSPLGPQSSGSHSRGSAARKPSLHRRFALGATLLTVCIAWLLNRRAASIPEAAAAPLRLLRTSPLPNSGLARQTFVGDYDGDKRPNLFSLNGNQLDVLDHEGELVRHLELPASSAEALRLDHLQDIDADGRDELFFSWRQGTNRIVSIRNQNLLELQQFRVSGAPSASSLGAPEYHFNRIIAQEVVDLDGDGKREFLAVLITGKEQTPRGVWCFDYESTDLRWSYETAPMVMSLRVADLDGDGRQEVIFTGNAVGNDKILPDETSDHEAWLYVLRADGKLKWKRLLETGEGTYCTLLLAGKGSNQAPEIYVSVTRTWEFHHQEMGRLLRFDAKGNETGRAEVGAFLRDAVVLEEAKGRELIVPDRNGVLWSFDADLRPIRHHQLVHRQFNDLEIQIKPMPGSRPGAQPNFICLSLDSERLSGDNEGTDSSPSNIALKHEPTLWVLGADFQILGRHRLADAWKLNLGFQAFPLPGSPGKPSRIAVLDESFRLFEFMSPTTIRTRL